MHDIIDLTRFPLDRPDSPEWHEMVARARADLAREGMRPWQPPFGPAGGTNFMSCQSLSEAIAGAFARGESGKAYLVGDENLSFADYFGLFFAAAGNPAPVPSLDQDHPMLPDIAIPQGRGNFIAYEPDAAEVALLGYRRHDVARAVAEVVRQFGEAA